VAVVGRLSRVSQQPEPDAARAGAKFVVSEFELALLVSLAHELDREEAQPVRVAFFG
jgi:hypothetical protein